MSDEIKTDLPPPTIEDITKDISPTNNQQLPEPDISDLFKEMRIEDRITTDVGPTATIDVIPDFRYIIYQLIDHSIKIFETMKSRNIPSLTPASILATCLQQIYAYGASADIFYIRDILSYQGQNFIDHSEKKQLVTLLTWMLTPPFVRDILFGLTPTCDPRRKNLCFIYSFAAFSFRHDVGRVYPVHMFIALHNIIAQKGRHATFDEIWREWLLYPVIQDIDETITVANIIGAAYENNYVDNFISTKLKQLLSVTTLGYQQRKAVYQEFPFNNIVIDDGIDTINAYDYVLGAFTQISPMMTAYIHTMSSQFEQIFTKCEPLGAYFSTPSGTNIMNHFYGEPITPTYHRLPVTLQAEKTKIESVNAFCDRLRYKCTYKCIPEPKVKVPQLDPDSPALEAINLVTKDTTQPPQPDTRISTFSRSKYGDNIILYSPWSTGESSMYYALTSGIHIESFEIDSFHVPYPSIDTSIHDENSHFLESGIPINSTIDYSHYDGNHLLYIRMRQQDEDDEYRISHSYFNMGIHTIPLYHDTITSALTGNLLPGFTPVKGITHPNLATTKFTVDPNTEYTYELCDEHLPIRSFVWSSYRWIDPMYAHTASSSDHIFYICDFRTLYGTIPQTQMSRHLFNLIK